MEARYLLNLIDSVNAWRETPTDAEDLIIDNCCQRQVIEDIGNHLPRRLNAVLLHSLVLKAVAPRHLAALMIAAKQGDTIRVLQL